MTTDVVAPAPETTAANGHGEVHSTASLKALLVGSIGVVYGDIGTSPLYALREAVVAASGPSGIVQPAAVLGVVSLILWALIIVVTMKYVVILLRADNHGEGGTLALMALAQRAVSRGAGVIVLLGIVSGALFYGDAVITPALSVLSAIEGIKLVTAALDPYVVPVTVIILLALFAAQSRGTARVAFFFGPIMCVWFGVIAIGAIGPIMRHPEVFLALDPLLAVSFMLHHGLIGFVTLGAVFLAVTGAEALYADLGHFGKRPIQTAWLFIVLPSLALNYLGQGALVIADPKAVENPFFLMFPDWALIPMVALATVATVIASQAVITGAYSLTQQAIQLGLLPRFEIRHTSESQFGQIYIPRVNMLLFIAVMLLVAAVPLVECAGLGLRHLGDRHHGGHGHDGVRRGLEGLEVVADCGCRADCAVPVPRSDVPCRQSLEGARRRLGSAGARRDRDIADVYVASRQQVAVREIAQARVPACRPRRDAGETAAAARAGHRRVPHQRPQQRADCVDA